MVENLTPRSLAALAEEIRMRYRSDHGGAEELIENHLERRLEGYSHQERMQCLERVTRHFASVTHETTSDLFLEPKELSQLLSLLLGKKIHPGDLSSTELLDKLSSSLNTLFDSVNQIIAVIHATLLGEKAELETIRTVIGSHLGEEGGTESLQSYLDQIREAFSIAHRAFQKAAHTKVKQILSELDPEHIASLSKGGLKFGALRKSDLFEVYEERFQMCSEWFESDRFMAEFLREFENICQKLYKKADKRTL